MTALTVIRPRPEDVEGQPILRPLPSRECRSVGPFVFFDHMLPTRYAPGSGMNIRQHPHIGLSTLTYLFDGALQHKDSLGSDQVVQAGDGQEALDFLYRRGEYTEAPRPDLVLLDLNLPKYDGRQVLEQIKGDPELALIPVVVLTTSSAEEDILRSYQAFAASYVVKPVEFSRFYEESRVIGEDGTVDVPRLRLCEATAATVKSGLGLLGIETLEEI